MLSSCGTRIVTAGYPRWRAGCRLRQFAKPVRTILWLETHTALGVQRREIATVASRLIKHQARLSVIQAFVGCRIKRNCVMLCHLHLRRELERKTTSRSETGTGRGDSRHLLSHDRPSASGGQVSRTCLGYGTWVEARAGIYKNKRYSPTFAENAAMVAVRERPGGASDMP